eukprot:COSAG01_NODE_30620_length_612_cov_2.087719_1_plen_92_part_00
MQNIREDEADMRIWSNSASPSCSCLTDQRYQRNLDNAVTMLRTEKLHHFKLFQAAQTAGPAPTDNSGMSACVFAWENLLRRGCDNHRLRTW